jgi:glycerophosphoryl diester phosphodiesterase
MWWKITGLIVLGIVVSLAIVYGVAALLTTPAEDHPFFEHEGVMVIAHQGGRGLWPDNTIYAFERAVAMGVDVLEMDVHTTADGVMVTMHDETVERTTNGSGPIRSYTLAELKQLDAGYKWTDDDGATYPYRGQGITVPTLEEIFTAFPDIPMNIEIKQAEPANVAEFCQMLRDFDREERVLVGSFDPDTVLAFRQACPEVATSVTETEARRFLTLNTIFLGAVYRPPCEAFSVPEYHGDMHVVTGRFVDVVHSHNMDVHVWTVNDEESMRRLIELNVDGIITDYPDRLLRVLGR